MILDASVACHWFVETEFSQAANPFRGQPDLIAPGLLLVEVANVLCKHVRGGRMPAAACQKSLSLLRNMLSGLVPDADLLREAVDVSLAHLHPVYDCLYLVLARRQGAPLLTADRKLATLARSLSIETPFVAAS